MGQCNDNDKDQCRHAGFINFKRREPQKQRSQKKRSTKTLYSNYDTHVGSTRFKMKEGMYQRDKRVVTYAGGKK